MDEQCCDNTDTSLMREVMQAHDEGTPVEQHLHDEEEWYLSATPAWNWWCNLYRIHLPTEPGSPLTYWQAREAWRRKVPFEWEHGPDEWVLVTCPEWEGVADYKDMYKFRLPLPNPEPKHDPGDGYRLLEVGEVIEAGDEFWDITGQWLPTVRAGIETDPSDENQYRRKLQSKKMVPLDHRDVKGGDMIRDIGFSGGWAGVCGARADGSDYDGIVVDGFDGNHLIAWEELQREREISRDGGKTWQRCEKEAE